MGLKFHVILYELFGYVGILLAYNEKVWDRVLFMGLVPSGNPFYMYPPKESKEYLTIFVRDIKIIK